MSNYLDNVIFQYYPSDIKKVVPLGNLSLRDFISAVKNTKPEILDKIEKIKNASNKGDLKLKSKLKSELYFFTPCILSDGKGRSYDNIKSFTGLCQIDFDGISNASKFRDFIFDTYKSVVLAGVSSSGMGVKALIRIPICSSVDEYKQYFCGLGYYLERFKGFDVAPYNPILPLYFFADKDLRFREDPTIAKVRGQKINEFKVFEGDIEVLENVLLWKKNKVKEFFTKGIDAIVSNGHPTVIGFSSMLGGYCASGYLSEDECMVLIEEVVYNNEYLSKDHRGYIKTAKNMLIRGMNSPLYLKCDEE
jgi:hypothetical protein